MRSNNESLRWRTPLEALTGITPDISKFLDFTFYDPVYYATDNTFPSTSPEIKGRWVGIADNVGDELTYKILTDDDQLLYRSAVRPVPHDDPTSDPPTPPTGNVNQRADGTTSGEGPRPIRQFVYLKGAKMKRDVEPAPDPVVISEPKNYDDLIGRSYLSEPDPDGRISEFNLDFGIHRVDASRIS